MSNPLSSSSSTYNQLLPKLNGTNYAMWKTKIEILLIRERLLLVVCQRQLCPTPPASSAGSRTRNNTTSPEIDAAALEWDENAEQVTTMIFLYLDEHAERFVIDICNPVELWEKLKTTYERKESPFRFYLGKSFLPFSVLTIEIMMEEMRWNSTLMPSTCTYKSFAALVLQSVMNSKHQYFSMV
jgi:hypothetical protein